MYIILAILAFGVLILIHELGHFTLAKINGVKVEKFSIGMGPDIFKIKGKETTYAIGLLPIGGYVKMTGEDQPSDEEGSFSSKSPLRRITIILAGAFMNYVLAIVIFMVITYNFGYRTTTVNEVQPNSPAQEAGLLANDKINKINNHKVFSNSDISTGINLQKGDNVDIQVIRDGEKKDFNIKPEKTDQGLYMVGISFTANQKPSIFTSFTESLNQTKSLVSQTFQSLKLLITGKLSLKTDVGGPVSIVKMSAETAKSGIWNLVFFTGFISVNLAVMNLLPFPALDGGWAVILLIELISGRKVPDKAVEIINTVGFALLMAFMLIVTVKDILFPIKF